MKTKTERVAWTPESDYVYTQNQIENACAANRPALKAFAGWLAARGLAPGTVTLRLGSARTFVDAVTARAGKSCVQAFQTLMPDGIEDIFSQYCKDRGSSARRSMRSAIRSFLRFAASQDWVDWDLVDAVPSLTSYRLRDIPGGLSDDELSTLLGSPWVGRCPHRDRAIVYLLATYGVRRGQVSKLRFADLDWAKGSIVFAAHKGGKDIHHTLTQAVAESLADYLRNERPVSDCGYVFLRQVRPHLQLGPGAITCLVKARMVSCGLPPRSPHAFRHAFATRLLRADQPVKAIADLLGHRSLAAIEIYAKVDRTRLFEVAVDWPEVAV